MGWRLRTRQVQTQCDDHDEMWFLVISLHVHNGRVVSCDQLSHTEWTEARKIPFSPRELPAAVSCIRLTMSVRDLDSHRGLIANEK